jgi:hypothetical protein
MAKTSRKQSWTPSVRGLINPRSRLGNRLMLGVSNQTQERLAISVLSALSIAGVHSALNPSLFTLLSFAGKPEARVRAMKGLWIGLGVSTLASLAIWKIFDDWMPATISEVTAVGLFAAGVWAINQPPATDVPAIQNQAQVVADQGI